MSEYRVLKGDSFKILRELRDPSVMAVEWTGAWSSASLRFAREQAERARDNDSGEALIPIPYSSTADSRQFREQLRFIGRKLHEAGQKNGVLKPVKDQSRIEPPTGHQMLEAAAPWHVDGRILYHLSVLSGITTKIMENRPAGRFAGNIFKPDTVQNGRFIANDSVLAMKGTEFPITAQKPGRDPVGLIHCRPNEELGKKPNQFRFFVRLMY